MKIAISSRGKTLDSAMDERFGRAALFIIYDTESKQFTTLDNAANASLGQGAGIQAAQAVAATGAERVITGRVGPNAQAALNAAGIDIVTVNPGTVEQALEQAQSTAQGTPQQPQVGMGQGTGGQGRGMGGQGQGMGLGRGMGGQGRGMGGQGRGMGQGRGRGRGTGQGQG
ncbi:MAG: NifB/NifX family molybdenum-iron cluster-binding protein [Proteobacteria bacterium]|nr:NifB/NifX family molybdenum-iron cluster-binding protein [Pseudomonadota bacterium]